MKKELIRTGIMNLTMAQWSKVKEIEKSGFIEVTPKELIDLIGFTGGMFFILKANEREKQFVESFYSLGNSDCFEESKTSHDKYCVHEFISREYSSQPYGTCLSCGKTVFS